MVQHHPAVIERVAAIIHERHLPFTDAERANAAGWELDTGERVTLSADELDRAYAAAMLMHAGVDPRGAGPLPTRRDP